MPPRNPMQAARLRDSLEMLRDYAGTHERGLHGSDEIIAYLNELGVKNGMGRAITKGILYNWVKTRGFPSYAINRANGMFTTNLLVLAWLWSFREFLKGRAYRCPKYKPRI